MTRRPDGLWQQQMTVTVNGKKKQKYFYGHTKAEIYRKIAAYEEEQERGLMFNDMADEWEENHKVRYKTAEAYSHPLEMIKKNFADMPFNDVTPVMITTYLESVRDLNLSRRTVQLHRDAINMICKYAISHHDGLIPNPCASVSVPDNCKPAIRRQLPKEDDIQTIIAHKSDDRFSLLPFLLLCTGLRLGEALALTDKDFGERISITKKVSWQPNQPVVDNYTKTEKGIRTVVILDVLREALPDFTGYLFSMSDDGKVPLTKSAFRKRWANYSKRTGVTCLRHELRHELITIGFEADVSPKDMAEMAGHSEEVMHSVYEHIRDSRRKKTDYKLNEYVNIMYGSQKTQ